MAVTARQTPDVRTVSDFRKRHLTALGELFTQVPPALPEGGGGDVGARRARWYETQGQRFESYGNA